MSQYLATGACCRACAQGGPCGSPLGLTPAMVAAAAPMATQASTAPASSSWRPLVIAAAAAGAIGLVWRLRRKRRNPARFTRKGERMYQHVRRGYGSSPRAKEIAARTVYAASRRGARGLVRER